MDERAVAISSQQVSQPGGDSNRRSFVHMGGHVEQPTEPRLFYLFQPRHRVEAPVTHMPASMIVFRQPVVGDLRSDDELRYVQSLTVFMPKPGEQLVILHRTE